VVFLLGGQQYVGSLFENHGTGGWGGFPLEGLQGASQPVHPAKFLHKVFIIKRIKTIEFHFM